MNTIEMKTLEVGLILAVLAFGFRGGNASEDREREREGWAVLGGVEVADTEANAPRASVALEPISIDCMPFEQSLLDRGSLGLPEHVLVPQMGGLLSYESDEQGESAWTTTATLSP